MTKKALVILAKGAEEMELVISTDVLRRAEIEVTVAGLGASPVVCSRKVKIVPDKSLQEAIKDAPYDVVVLPGGLEGSENLSASEDVKKILLDQEANDRWIAAICAAPCALKAHGIGKNKFGTSYPSKESELSDHFRYKQDRVVTDGKLITSRGPGTSFEFALKIVDSLLGTEKASSVKAALLCSN